MKRMWWRIMHPGKIVFFLTFIGIVTVAFTIVTVLRLPPWWMLIIGYSLQITWLANARIQTSCTS